MRRGGAKWLLASLLCSFHVQKELGRRERIRALLLVIYLKKKGGSSMERVYKHIILRTSRLVIEHLNV
jgi:hypothetical protein